MSRRRVAFVGNSASTPLTVVPVLVAVALILVTVFTAHDLALSILWPLMAFTFAVNAYQQWRNRVGFDDEGLVVGGPRLTRRVIGWPDVGQFEVRRDSRELGVWTVDGRWIHLQAYAKNQLDTAYGAANLLNNAQRQAGLG